MSIINEAVAKLLSPLSYSSLRVAPSAAQIVDLHKQYAPQVGAVCAAVA